MSYQKNEAGQKFMVLAVNTTNGQPFTGDAANITAKISKDFGSFASLTDTNPTELDSTNAAGVYVFDLSQAETNGDVLTIMPSSATANVQIDMLNIYTTSVTGYTPEQIADQVWDELLIGSTHNIPTSAGRRLREIAEVGLYEGAAVWIDTVNGTAGTDDYENGTVINPSNNIADATTIATSVGLARFKIAPASTMTLASGYNGFAFIGDGMFTLALGGQSLTDTTILNAAVSGVCTSADEPVFDCCTIGAVTIPACFIRNSRLSSDITLSAAGTYHFEGCASAVAGTASPSIDFGAAVGSTNVNFRHYSGGIEVLNMGAAGTDNMSLEGDGALTINANCTGGTIALRGNFKLTDNSGGAVTVVRDDDTTLIEGVKTTTDQFRFTVANQVDANTVGSGDATAAKQNEILGKLAASSVVYTNPSSPNKLTLIRGDAYDDAAENNGKLTWATGKTLTGATVRFTIRDANDNILIDQTTAGVSTAVNAQTAEVLLTSAATALLTVATTHKFDAEAYWAADNRWTFARGQCVVLEDQTRS